jgi:hypothetical protein
MSDIEQGPPEGQETSASSFTLPDTEVARAWLSGLCGAIADIKAVTEDQQRPRRERRLGHLEAVRITREGFATIEAALSYAECGLSVTTPVT